MAVKVQTAPETVLSTDGIKEGGSISTKDRYAPTKVNRSEKTLHYTLSSSTEQINFDMRGYESCHITIDNNGTSPNTVFVVEGGNNPSGKYSLINVEVSSTNSPMFRGYLRTEFRQYNSGAVTYSFNRSARFVKIRTSGMSQPHEVTITLSPSIYVSPKNTIATSPDSIWRNGGQSVTAGNSIVLKSAGSPALKFGLIKLLVKNTGTVDGTFIIAENGTTPLETIFIAAGERIELNYENMPLMTSTGGITLNLTSVAAGLILYVNATGLTLNA